MTIKELLQDKTNRQQVLVNTARGENRGLSDIENSEYNILQKDIESLTALMGNERNTDNPEDNTRAAIVERERITEITTLCRQFEVEPDEYIRGGTDLNTVKDKILKKLMEDQPPINTRGNDQLQVNKDEEDKYRAAAADGLLLRSGITPGEVAAGAEEMRNISFRDLAIDTLQRSGNTENLFMKSQDEVFELLSR